MIKYIQALDASVEHGYNVRIVMIHENKIVKDIVETRAMDYVKSRMKQPKKRVSVYVGGKCVGFMSDEEFANKLAQYS